MSRVIVVAYLTSYEYLLGFDIVHSLDAFVP